MRITLSNLLGHSDLLKIEKSIEKESNLIQKMNKYIEKIAKIDDQMRANSQLLAIYKTPTN